MLAFSILVNNYSGPAADVRVAIDRVCVLMIPFLILGIAAGFVQLIRQVLRDTRDDGS
jgi:hypothetical protein